MAYDYDAECHVTAMFLGMVIEDALTGSYECPGCQLEGNNVKQHGDDHPYFFN